MPNYKDITKKVMKDLHLTNRKARAGEKNYVQPSRVGKQLIGTYIDRQTAELFREKCAAHGITVQKCFEKFVIEFLNN